MWPEPAGARAHAARGLGVAMLVLVVMSCRIYREEPPVPRDDTARGRKGSEEVPANPPRDERPAAASTPASEALNLWVLNRPKGDLVPQTAPVPSVPASLETRPKAIVVVVLGFGPPEPCAEQLARDAVMAIDRGADPLRVTAGLLAGVRGTRWPRAEGSFSAILRGSDGRFGGIQRAPAGALTADSLIDSLSRQVLIDGTRLRPRALAAQLAEPSLPSACSARAQGSLEGTPGVLVRTGAGFVWGGIVSPDLPADAGVLSIFAQYGVSVAVGGAGGVLLITDCSPPPAAHIAERVYASSDWVAAAAGPESGDACRVGHALLTSERAWVQSSSPLAWAALEQEVHAPQSAPSAIRAPDAGAPRAPSPEGP
jgi:hypothetical protein